MDADLSMRTHVLRTAAGCFAVLRRIKSIRRSLTKPVLQSLVVALVLSRLDYGSTVLFGLPQQLHGRQVSVCSERRCTTDTCCRRRDRISQVVLYNSIYYIGLLASAHCFRIFTGCGLLTVSRFGWRYSPTAAFTVEHLST